MTTPPGNILLFQLGIVRFAHGQFNGAFQAYFPVLEQFYILHIYQIAFVNSQKSNGRKRGFHLGYTGIKAKGFTGMVDQVHDHHAVVGFQI